MASSLVEAKKTTIILKNIITTFFKNIDCPCLLVNKAVRIMQKGLVLIFLGLILDSLGVDCDEVRSYLKQTVVELVFMVQENVRYNFSLVSSSTTILGANLF